MNELPLQDLFNRLRDQGLPLGIDEYMAVLRALQAGVGVGDLQDLELLCRIVWAKSGEEARLLHTLFGQLLRTTGTPHPPKAPAERSRYPKVADLTSEQLPATAVPKQNASGESSGSVAAPPGVAPDLSLGMDGAVQVVEALQHRVRSSLGLWRPRFGGTGEYFPVTRRQMKQIWRYMRRLGREGRPEELDVAATIEKIGREGIMLEPVLVPRRRNQAELVLLIDEDGSMVPFHALSRQLVETARAGGRLRRAGVYYFHDYPGDYLYRDPARLEAQLLLAAMMVLDERTAVLIVSDAGAARGNMDPERVERTRAFLQLLKQVVRHFAWLNPMPHTRWAGTTAGEIARHVPMFELSRQGLDAAVGALRGRYVYGEKMTPWTT